MSTTTIEHATVDATVDANGTTTIPFEQGLPRDARKRFPAAVALAQATGGLYAENLAGMDIPAALAAAGLNFTVSKEGPITVPDGRGGYLAGLNRWRGTVGNYPDSTGKPPVLLGVVGDGYPVVQPAATAEFGQAILDEAGGTVVAVCAYGDPRGSRMVLALKLPEGLLIGGEDRHDLYLYVGNSFNRETPVWACAAPIRLDCTNQVAGTFRGRASRWSLSHRGDMEFKIQDARDALKITGTFAEAYTAAAEEMLATPFSGAELDAFVEELLPTPRELKTERGEQAWEQRRYALKATITSGERNTVGRGSRYAAYQGVVEMVDHMSPAKTAARQYMRIVDGGAAEQVKARAARLLMVA
jgi:hypothetical protein